MLRVRRRAIRNVTAMEADGAMALGTADLARLLRKRLDYGHSLPFAHLLAVPNEKPLHFTFVDLIFGHGISED